MNARDITKHLGGDWYGGGGSACCPVPSHEDKNPSLSIREGEDGTILLKCHAGCESAEVVAALKDMSLWPTRNVDSRTPIPQRRPRSQEPDPDRERRGAYARELWLKAASIESTPAERYLRERSLRGPFPPTLRYLAGCKHTGTGLHLPTMIAAVSVWPCHKVIAVHRTFLTADGRNKAPVSDAKKMLGPVAGGSVRLAPAAEEMAVGEGLESCLSVQQEAGLPTWAALSTSGLKSLKLPDLPLGAVITIAADHDQPGLKAAEEAAQRWLREGREVRIAKPPTEGEDFNDLLRNKREVAA